MSQVSLLQKFGTRNENFMENPDTISGLYYEYKLPFHFAAQCFHSYMLTKLEDCEYLN